MKHPIKYQQVIKKRYDKRVKQKTFHPRDWILNKVIRTLEYGNLNINQKSPYVIDEIASNGPTS